MNRKRKPLTVLSVVLYIAVGLIIGAAYIFDSDEGNITLGGYFLILFSVVVSVYAHVIIHELGHLIFGLLTGYKFSSFRIGVFTLIKGEDDKLKFKLIRVPGTAGQCLLEPPEPINGTIPQRLYNLGGIVMNVILSSVVLAVKLLCGIKGAAGIFLLTLVMIGYVLAILNGLPIRDSLICNDGLNAMYASRSPKANRAMYNTLKISWYSSKGYRLRDMPEELFVLPDKEGLKRHLEATEAVSFIGRAIDLGEFKFASEIIDTVLEHGEAVPGAYKNPLYSDRLFVSLMLGKDINYIESLFDKNMKELIKLLPNAMFGIYSAYAYEKLYKGDLQKADKIRRNFTKKSKAYPYKGELESVEWLMNRVDVQWNIWNNTANE